MKPFSIHVPDDALSDLRLRLSITRWPDEVEGSGWRYGSNRDFLKRLHEHWLTRYDWRRIEAELNAWPQYMVDIDGHAIHFVHVRSGKPGAKPLLLTSGWPSSFPEYEKIIPLLTPHFDLVIPCMPGFGFSAATTRPGFVRIDNLWRKLMIDVLGYDTFLVHGTDVGARVTSDLGRYHGDVVRAIHLGSVDLDWPEHLPAPDELTPEEADYIERVHRWEKEEGAYAEIQATFPQTVAYALNDSPLGLASWIVEKFYRWGECNGDVEAVFGMDHLITNVSIYWFTQSINASMRRYFEVRKNPRPTPRIQTPTAIAMFPGEKDLLVPRSWAERVYNVYRWKPMPAGGHFPAFEQPELLATDLIQAFRDV